MNSPLFASNLIALLPESIHISPLLEPYMLVYFRSPKTHISCVQLLVASYNHVPSPSTIIHVL